MKENHIFVADTRRKSYWKDEDFPHFERFFPHFNGSVGKPNCVCLWLAHQLLPCSCACTVPVENILEETEVDDYFNTFESDSESSSDNEDS